jgi:hypothetical protein
MKHWKWHLFCLVVLVISLVPVRVYSSGFDLEEAVLPYRYAWVGTKDVPVYVDAGDPAKMSPVRYLPAYNTWVSIKDEVKTEQCTWYRVGEHEYVLSGDVWVGSLSTFHGVSIGRGQRPPLGFVLVDELNVRSAPDVAADSLYTLARYAVIKIQGQMTVDGETWYRIGRNQYVNGDYVRVAVKIRRPAGILPGEKWIAVNLAEQTLVAYEGGRMVFATLVSTGLPWWQTPEGLFRIWTKVRVGNMSRTTPEGGYYYYLQDVPWTMYFQGPYGLHAAYWHDGFGYQRSRGCVNLSPRDARWLFEWAAPSLEEEQQVVLSTEESPGTWVYIHNTPAPLAQFETWLTLRPAERGLVE